MDSNEIYNQVINRFPNKIIPDLLKAMLQEACEHVANSTIEDTDKSTYAIIAFGATIPPFKAMLEAAFQQSNDITLNYRGQTFDLTPETPYLKELFSISDELQKLHKDL